MTLSSYDAESYLKRKIGVPKTYRQYLTTAAKTSPAAAYADALRSSVPTGVSPAEKSTAAGLSRSGYADYLKAQEKKKTSAAQTSAAETYADSVRQAASGYRDYLTSYQKAQNDRVKQVVSALKNAGTLQYDDAYRYALAGGLTGKAAETAAAQGIAEAESKLRISALRTVINRQLNPSRARAFAASLGLSEETVTEVGNFAEAYAYASVRGEDLEDLYEQYLSTHKEERNSP